MDCTSPLAVQFLFLQGAAGAVLIRLVAVEEANFKQEESRFLEDEEHEGTSFWMSRALMLLQMTTTDLGNSQDASQSRLSIVVSKVCYLSLYRKCLPLTCKGTPSLKGKWMHCEFNVRIENTILTTQVKY
jgi:hypothetical protein